MNRLLTTTTALCAMGLMLFSASVEAKKDKPISGSLDVTFNPGGPKPGVVVKAMSPFLNIAEGIGIQRDSSSSSSSSSSNCPSSSSSSSSESDYKIIVIGDAVQQINPFEPACPICIPCARCDESGSSERIGQIEDLNCCDFIPPCSGFCGETGAAPCGIDGFVDERGWSILRLRSDGSVDKSFGSNGNGRVFLQPGVVTSSTAQHGLNIDTANRIIYVGATQSSSSDVLCGPNAGGVGVGGADPTVPCCCDFQYLLDPNHSNIPYGQTILTVGRFEEDGALDNTFGTNGLFSFPIVPNSLGDYPNATTQDPNDNILVVGYRSPDLKGCIYSFPLILRIKGGNSSAGTLDTSFNGTGFVAEGSVNGGSTCTACPPGSTSQNDTTSFSDYTVNPAQNLGYSEYEAVAVHNNGGHLQGYIVTVGDGDINGIQWPGTARIIAARYKPNGSLDTSFGVNGYLVISAQNTSLNPIQKQLLARAVAIDAKDNIYLGGDIADNFSGPPGATSTQLTSASVLVARPTANFLLIKLNSQGQPQDYGPALTDCNGGGCNSTVFESCRTCLLNWNDGSTTHSFRAVTTDFGGFDDAIFDLLIDNKKKTILAVGQASEDAALQSMRNGFARYKLSTGGLDPSFGTYGLVIVDGGRNRRSLVRNAVFDPDGKILAAGQSGFSEEEIEITNFSDATIKDFEVIRLNP